MTCNVGDSRVYFFRSGVLHQITRDHSKSQRLVSMGILTEEEARNHPSKHELTQHLGIFPEEMLIDPEFSDPLDVHPGDLFLLCSDGLTDMVDDGKLPSCSLSTRMFPKKRTHFSARPLTTAAGTMLPLSSFLWSGPPLLQRMLKGKKNRRRQYD